MYFQDQTVDLTHILKLQCYTLNIVINRINNSGKIEVN